MAAERSKTVDCLREWLLWWNRLAEAILYDSPSNRVFTLNGDAHSSTVIDPQAGKLIANVPLGGKPEYGASAGDGKIYVNLTDTSEVVEINAKTATVVRRWSAAPCKQPVAMAIDTARHRLFSGCRSGVMQSPTTKRPRWSQRF
jgi:DNA-binding beta-propeller fold protein YncE